MGKVVARDLLYKLIFENLFVESENSVSFNILLENIDLNESELDYVKSSYIDILKNKESIIEIIKNNVSSNFNFQRIFKADLAILILAVYEITTLKLDYKIAINEAVKLAKKYSTDKSFAFVNGVLAKIVQGESV